MQVYLKQRKFTSLQTRTLAKEDEQNHKKDHTFP